MKDVPWPTVIGALTATIAALFGLVTFTIRAILRGDLVPRKVLHDANARADKWELAWEKSEARLDQFDGRLDAITEAAALNTQLLSALVERARS